MSLMCKLVRISEHRCRLLLNLRCVTSHDSVNHCRYLSTLNARQTVSVFNAPQTKINHQNQGSVRHLWGWLNSIFNRFDPERVKQVGADRACAEWLLRCGASVKWSTHKNFVKDYNQLPVGGPRLFISEVNASDSAIMSIGFPHFKGCKQIRRLVLHKASYIDDESLYDLQFLRSSLKELQVSACGNVTDTGLKNLAKLKNLEYLLLYDFPAVKDKVEVEKYLQGELPDCAIVFTYASEKEHGDMMEKRRKEEEEKEQK